MKKIWGYLRTHIREDFNLRYYALTGLLLLAILFLNYYYDFEDTYLENMEGWPKLGAYLIFYSAPYMTATYIWAWSNYRKDVFKSRQFWLRFIFGVGVLSIDSSLPFLSDSLDAILPAQIQYWAYKVAVNAISYFTVLIPLMIFYWVYDRNDKHAYGLNVRNFDTSPYFFMLLIMLPLIVGASFNDRFLVQYPMYKVTAAHAFLGVPEWLTVAIYELAYGLDFVTVELLFRGFFVIGMMKVLGRGAVLTMAVVYCVLHFGKPAGEAVSSIFGGFILGVIAFETKSIWGGIIVHMGIAWMMEAVAFTHKLFLNENF